jgi:CRISPR/Cas system-associated exonuclease Cas4 (RecB family)
MGIPKVVEDKEFVRKIYDALQEREKILNSMHAVSPERIRVHALLGCLKKAYWDIKVDELELPINEKAIGYYIIGRSHHDMLECLKGFFKEQSITKWGIYGTIDMLGEMPVEIKSTRVKPMSYGGINPYYIKQLGFYCVLAGSKKGKLIIFYVIEPTIYSYDVEFTDEEIEAYRLEMIDKAERLRKALETGDVSLLEGTNWSWECDGCSYRIFCKK